MLYSLGAMTTFGNHDLALDAQWRLMGSLEALNGWILFGLTTAFLFTVNYRGFGCTVTRSPRHLGHKACTAELSLRSFFPRTALGAIEHRRR